MSGQLPQEQMREAKADITRCIDWVNMKLELDLVPNVDGDFIDPRACSVVELYKVVSGGRSVYDLFVNFVRGGG